MNHRMIILTQGNTDPIAAKTATSVIRYRTEEVAAILDSTEAGRTSEELLGVGGDIPIIASLAEAPEAQTLLIGIAPAGGRIPTPWREIILEAISRKMEIVSGLHEFLCDDPEFADAAKEHGVRLVDVRKNDEQSVAMREGIREDCLRVHAVGNDCGVGKMVVAIEIARALEKAGHDAKFVATGQTGIMIAGDGCPVDCVVADFVNGAAERLVLENQSHDILLIEGQGSLFHPKYSAVTLGLLHGCIPHGMVLCYEVGRTQVSHMEQVSLSPLAEVRQVYETMANVMQPSKVIGVAMNSRRVSPEQAEKERQKVRQELGLPVCDIFRHGPGDLVEAVLSLKNELKM